MIWTADRARRPRAAAACGGGDEQWAERGLGEAGEGDGRKAREGRGFEGDPLPLPFPAPEPALSAAARREALMSARGPDEGGE